MAITKRVLEFQYVPAANSTGGTVTVNIGTYYNQANTRIVQASAVVSYQDNTAGTPAQLATGRISIQGASQMELPQTAFTPSAGLVFALDHSFFQAGDPGFLPFNETVILNDPTFDIVVSLVKPDPGMYPPSYQFNAWINLQFEFGEL